MATEIPTGELLLVEDDQADAALVSRLLQKAQIFPRKVRLVGSLSAAKAALENHEIDAVLLDLGLPDCQGVECVRALRQVAPDLPVVVLTGREDSELAMTCLAAGAQDYLSKGQIGYESLRRAIQYARARVRENTAQRRAAELEGHLATIVGSSHDAIFSVDLNDRILTWNRGAATMFGLTPKQAIGRHDRKAFHLRNESKQSSKVVAPPQGNSPSLGPPCRSND